MVRMPRGGALSVFLSLAWVLCGAARIGAAQPDEHRVDAKFLQELRWRSIGPSRGGRALAVTGVRGEPDVYYFGAVGGGLWKTDDSGRTWNPVFDSQPVASVGAIAVAPSNPKIIYLGSGEADMRSSISSGNGMYKSTDGGQTWAQIGLPDTRQIARILVDPDDANRVLVAALGHPYGPNSERGVYRSTDGGQSWQRILFKDENTGAIDLAFEPGNKQTIYAALWQTRRPPWSIYPPSNGPGSGLYRSRDGGEHWEQLSGHGLPVEGLGRIGVALAPSNPQRIYLLIDAKEGGVYRSDDGAQNWKRVSSDRRVWQRGWYFGELSVDPKNPDTVYIPNTSAYRSRDGGASFDAWKGAPGGDDYHALWIDPDNPQRMIMSSDQGAIVTRNAGNTWSSWYNQPTGQFYHVITDHQFPYWVYGAQQDSGAAATPSRGKYLALNFHDWRPIEAGDENGYIAPDPVHRGVIYGGFVTREDLGDEAIQWMPPTLAQPAAPPGGFRRAWTLPLVFSPIDPHVLYFGSQVLFRTADGGSSWQAISPDLTREDPGVPANLDAATAADAPPNKRRGVIYTIAPSFLQAGEIWSGTDDGRIQLTQDEGKNWQDVTPPEITAWSKVTHIEASHFEAGAAFAAVDRHRLEDYAPYLYRTRDFGKTWKRISQGIPEGSFLNCVREDTARKGLLFACTEKGVYLSFDDGDSWQSLQLNLPFTSVRDLVVHVDDLVIATFGRALWILDDMTPLRQIDARVAASDMWLFRPQITYRVRHGYDQGTPVPADEPLSENPPNGAVLDYYLKESSSAPIQLEILASDGKLVRRFASDDHLSQTVPKAVPFTMNWAHDPQPLLASAGTHRFIWDLHSALPQGVHRSELLSAGPWVPPGIYTVKLTVNGKSALLPLPIEPDPRTNAAREALQRQFALATRLNERLGEVAIALQQANDLRNQIADRKKDAAGNDELLAALEHLHQKTEVASEAGSDDEFTLFGLALPKKDHEPLPAAAAALTGLLLVLESADAAPAADVTTAAESWYAAGQEALTRWQKILAEDRVRANALLQKANLKPLVLDPLVPRPPGSGQE
jgi:photosystem II stability/assembly factor-like uncharacterized protein